MIPEHSAIKVRCQRLIQLSLLMYLLDSDRGYVCYAQCTQTNFLSDTVATKNQCQHLIFIRLFQRT